MPIQRRDFMKLLGVSLASLYLNRGCTLPIPAGCYAPMPLSTAPPSVPTASTARERLRLYWLRFDELAKRTLEDTDSTLQDELIAGHRAELDALAAQAEIAAPVADLVQEAYSAAVFHVWRSNVNITCYEPVIVDYAPTSANVLVEQSQVLNQLAAAGTIDPATLARAQAALEHDMAFYALTDEEVQSLYDELLNQRDPAGSIIPTFEELDLQLTPEAQAATQFIIELLTGK